jgi:hypothetical protein
MAASVPVELRERIDAADRGACCYCRVSVANSGIPLSFDHIEPRAAGGATTFENVCRCCRPCNEFKSDLSQVEDPLTGERTALFHPRRQAWREHFTWSEDASRIEGLTATGRATVVALRLNRPPLTAARRRWLVVGWHPPTED